MRKQEKSHYFFINIYYLLFYVGLFFFVSIISLLDGYGLALSINNALGSCLYFFFYGGILFAYIISWIYTLTLYGLDKRLENKIPNAWLRKSLIISSFFCLLLIFSIVTNGTSKMNITSLIIFYATTTAPGYILAYLMSKYDMKAL